MLQRPLKAIIFALSLTVAGHAVVAQKNFLPGYVITKTNDSLTGEINFRDWGSTPSHITFRGGSAEKVSEFGAADLRAFGVNGDRYESRFVHLFPYSTDLEILTSVEGVGKPYDTTVFLQVVTTGKLTLWEYRVPGGTDYYFVNDSDNHPEQLRFITSVATKDGITGIEHDEQFKNQLSYLLRDCPAAARRIPAARYNSESLERLFFIYNNCGRDTVEKKKVRGTVQFFPLVGYFSTKVKFTGSDVTAAQTYPAYSSIVGGAGMLFFLPRNRQELSFVTDIVWQHFHSESNAVADNNYISESGHLDYSLLKLEILFRYRYPTGRIRPFVEGGMANSATMGMNCYQTLFDNLDNTSNPEPMLNEGLRYYQFGWILGAGIGGKRWTVEGRFEASPGISDVPDVASPTKTWYLLVSFAL